MLPEDCIIEIVRALLNDGEKPTATKLQNFKGFATLPEPIVFTVRILDSKAENNVTITTLSKNYKVRIDWGDDKIYDFSIEEKITHVYDFPGVYKIKVFDLGGFSHIQLPVETCEVLNIAKITSCRNLLKNCAILMHP